MTTTEATTETVDSPVEDEQDVATTDTPQEPQESAEQSEDEAAEDPGAEDDSQTRKLRAEAKKYRTQLRETQTERDTLSTQVEQLQKTHAEAALSDILSKPSSLWMTGTNPSDFFDESGALDVDGLRSAAKASREEHGLGAHRRFGGSADGGVRQSTSSNPTFADAFRPKQ